jgi:hypothetical protein
MENCILSSVIMAKTQQCFYNSDCMKFGRQTVGDPAGWVGVRNFQVKLDDRRTLTKTWSWRNVGWC